MDRRDVAIAALAAIAVWPWAVGASSITTPHTFANNTTADAGEVNANFAAIRTAVNDNDERITDNAASSAANSTAIAANSTAIAGNSTDIAGNSTDITNNSTVIAANGTDIAVNTAALDDLERVYRLNGRYFKLYGAEITGNSNSASSVAPHLNLTATRTNHIGSAVFEMVGTPHCGYCYSAGPKAIIYANGNVPYAFRAVGDSVYVDLGTNNQLTIRSSHPIEPEALTSIPAGGAAVVAMN